MQSSEDSVEKVQIAEVIRSRICHFIQLKRLHKLIMGVLERCAGKEIRNDLVYNQLVFSALDGLFCRLINFTHDLYNLFDQEIKVSIEHVEKFKIQNRDGFNRSAPKGIFLGNWTEEMKMDVTRATVAKQKAHFNEVYGRLFPNVRKEGRGKPNHQDFDSLKAEVEKAMEPIRAHRNTVVAHRDPFPSPTTPAKLEQTMSYLENLLADLYFVCTLDRYIFEIGGLAASVESTADEIALLSFGGQALNGAKMGI